MIRWKTCLNIVERDDGKVALDVVKTLLGFVQRSIGKCHLKLNIVSLGTK